MVLGPGVHHLTAPLTFGPEDSGEAGRFRVTWAAAEPNATLFDGGVQIPGPWTAAETLMYSTSVGVWSAPLPAALREHARDIRQLYVGDTRYSRTRTSSADLGVPKHATLTSDGLRMASLAPEQWKNPLVVEIVSDHTWVQHRCPVTGVSKLAMPPPPPAPPLHKGTCEWTPKTKGHSPGSSLKMIRSSTYENCQKACCEALPKCEGIIFNSENCYLLDRKYEHGYMPDGGGFVADLNCSSHMPPSCDGVAPPLPQPTVVNISTPCFRTATKPGALALSLGNLAFFENTGNFTAAGQFYIDIEADKILVSHSDTAPQNVVVGVTQTLMRVENAHDMTWNGLTFTHSGWADPSKHGIVERYGGTLFDLQGSGLHSSPAAVEVAASNSVNFENCSFEHLGAWGLRLSNGTQHASVSGCHFHDLSGGGICVGNVDDSNETRPNFQMADVVIADNVLVGMGAEYKGAPGIHTYCMRQSSIEHNLIKEVSYTGISYNWPVPQGPTFGGPQNDGDASIGYCSVQPRIQLVLIILMHGTAS